MLMKIWNKKNILISRTSNFAGFESKTYSVTLKFNKDLKEQRSQDDY